MIDGRLPLLLMALSLALTGCEGGPPTTPISPTSVAVPRSSQSRRAPLKDFVLEIFVDYQTPAHAGAGPHPTNESSDFRLMQGGVRWFGGADVAYQIIGTEPFLGASNLVVSAEESWDALVTTRTFVRKQGSPSADPCGGVNTVQWVAMDGPGGVLASAGVCRNVATKEMVGFLLSLDMAEEWSSDGAEGMVDVENVAAHEWGHIVGLGHVNPPRSGCLTMYRYSGLGEVQKRTLGLGDKLGMAALYGPLELDLEPGSGCGG